MKFLAFCLTLVFFAGCNKSDYIPVHGGGGESSSQWITGNVVLFDDLDNPAPNSNMTVSIDGTSFTATTDTAGKYSFTDVPAGTYNLTYSKPGYGTYRRDTFHVVYNARDTSIVQVKELGAFSTTTVTDLFISVEGDKIKIIPTINPAGNETISRGVRFFYGADESVTGANFVSNSIQFRLKRDSEPIKFDKTDFYVAGFSSGDTVYVRVYGDAIHSNGYTDLTTGKKIYPNLNPTTVAAKSFVLP